MKFKKLGMGILCAVMACGILAGCGGGGDDPMTAMVKSSGQAVKYGDKEAKVLALETPSDIKNLDTYNGGIYWLKDAFYAVGYTNPGVMKFTIKDKKIVIPENNVIVKNAEHLDGTDGTRLYYVTKESPHLHSAILDGKDEGPILKEDGGWFTPAPSGKQGFIWFNNQKIKAVKMENGKITNVDQTNWFKDQTLSGPVGMVINGESVFLKTSAKINGKDQRFIAEFKMDGTLVRKYGDKNVKEPGGLDGLGGWAVTKDYVVIYDNMNGRFNVYKRADGSFVAAIDRDKAGMKGSADAITTISGNLIMTYGNLNNTSYFYMILL